MGINVEVSDHVNKSGLISWSLTKVVFNVFNDEDERIYRGLLSRA